MFYFHREVLTGLDSLHLAVAAVVPPFLQCFVIWDVMLRNPVADSSTSRRERPRGGGLPRASCSTRRRTTAT